MSNNYKYFLGICKEAWHPVGTNLDTLWVYTELMLLSWIYSGHLCVWQGCTVCVWGARGQRRTQARITQADTDTCGCCQSKNQTWGRKVGLLWAKMRTFVMICIENAYCQFLKQIMDISKVTSGKDFIRLHQSVIWLELHIWLCNCGVRSDIFLTTLEKQNIFNCS